MKRDVRLLHRGNLGEEPVPVDFAAGEEVEILREWSAAYLCRNAEGLLFNIPKELVEPDG